MNKTELIDALSKETTYSKSDVSRMLDACMRIIKRTLKKGDKVQLSNFGTFVVSERPERNGINPATKEKIRLPKTRTPKFRAGKQFKEEIRSL